MNKKVILSIFMATLFLLLMQSASARGYNSYNKFNTDWDAYNQYLEDRIPHNRMYDFFKYGSPWQGDVVFDLTYSSPPMYFPRVTAQPMMNYRHRYQYNGYNGNNYVQSGDYNSANYNNHDNGYYGYSSNELYGNANCDNYRC